VNNGKPNPLSLDVAAQDNNRWETEGNPYDREVWLLAQLRSPNLTHGIALVSGAHRRH
tara:strand:- start:14707 stop:14880 length:174 start_codon:yes stop_codon:yes gene_type:complete